jgi:hypothetical protein
MCNPTYSIPQVGGKSRNGLRHGRGPPLATHSRP